MAVALVWGDLATQQQGLNGSEVEKAAWDKKRAQRFEMVVTKIKHSCCCLAKFGDETGATFQVQLLSLKTIAL